jgi:hypothetical protein
MYRSENREKIQCAVSVRLAVFLPWIILLSSTVSMLPVGIDVFPRNDALRLALALPIFRWHVTVDIHNLFWLEPCARVSPCPGLQNFSQKVWAIPECKGFLGRNAP